MHLAIISKQRVAGRIRPSTAVTLYAHSSVSIFSVAYVFAQPSRLCQGHRPTTAPPSPPERCIGRYRPAVHVPGTVTARLYQYTLQ
jgi:hypothetical protein